MSQVTKTAPETRTKLDGSVCPDAPFAYAVLDWVVAHPDGLDQAVWLSSTACGTVGCFAGWTVVHRDGLDAATRLGTRNLGTRAAAILGIGPQCYYDDAYWDLFIKSQSLDQLADAIHRTFGPRPADVPVLTVPEGVVLAAQTLMGVPA